MWSQKEGKKKKKKEHGTRRTSDNPPVLDSRFDTTLSVFFVDDI